MCLLTWWKICSREGVRPKKLGSVFKVVLLGAPEWLSRYNINSWSWGHEFQFHAGHRADLKTKLNQKQSGLAGLEKWPENKVEKEQVQASLLGRKCTVLKPKARQIGKRKDDESAPSSNWAVLCVQLMLSVTATRTDIWILCRNNEFAVKNAKSRPNLLGGQWQTTSRQ